MGSDSVRPIPFLSVVAHFCQRWARAIYCVGEMEIPFPHFSTHAEPIAVSHTLFRDSSSARSPSAINMPSVPPGPPTPPPGPNPSDRVVDENSVDSRDATQSDQGTAMETDPARRAQGPASAESLPKRTKSVPPPPPPPRSTLPPVRPVSEAPPPRTGIGSANNRWRGNLPAIMVATPQSAKPSRSNAPPAEEHAGLEPPANVAGTDEEDATEAVTRDAPSWLLSLVMHLIVLLVLALITSPAGNGFTSLVLDFGMADESTDDAVDLDLSTPIMTETIEAPEDALDDTLLESDIPDLFDTIEPAAEEAIEPVVIGTESIEIGKPMYSGRTGAMRKALMAMYGATDETQEAVKLGLQWLKRQQYKNGSWSLSGPFKNGAFSENRCAATAMALIAFAGDGNTHLSGPYRKEVEKGVKFLVSIQDRGGFMANRSRGNDKTYSQAQATIALCELYGMTKDSWLRPYAQNAVDWAEKAQSSGGGWRYRPRERGDTSVTGWYVMALQSALGAGLEVNDSKMRLITNYLDSVSQYQGAAYSYQPGGTDRTPTMSAEGLLCRQYLGWKRNNPAMVDGMNLLRSDAPFDIRDHNVYYWYYATQVFHHYGGDHWKDWNDQMKVKLPAIQVREGDERGSWAPQNDRWAIGGRLYTTCLSIYCLEVYYRHLPLYDQK